MILIHVIHAHAFKPQKTFDSADGAKPELRNPDVLVGVEDLTELSYMHEPGVLNTLQVGPDHHCNHINHNSPAIIMPHTVRMMTNFNARLGLSLNH